MTTPAAASLLSSLMSALLSILFWIALGLAAVLAGILVLSPRWLTSEQLRFRYAENARIAVELTREADHLVQLSHALSTDSDYLSRVAASEFHAVTPGSVHIPFTESQTVEKQYMAASKLLDVAPAFEPSPLLELAATGKAWRQRLAAGVVLLLLLSFACFNDSFFQGGLRDILNACASRFNNRYAIEGQQRNRQPPPTRVTISTSSESSS